MAVQGSRVPKFGGWGSGENAPNYTIHFTKAREDKVAGKMINPNDPQQNPHMFPNTNGTRVEPEPKRNGVRGHVRRVSREDGEFTQVKESAARNDKMGKRAASDQSRQQSRTKSANRGDDETPEGGALIPPFGKWDEKTLNQKISPVNLKERESVGMSPESCQVNWVLQHHLSPLKEIQTPTTVPNCLAAFHGVENEEFACVHNEYSPCPKCLSPSPDALSSSQLFHGIFVFFYFNRYDGFLCSNL